MIESSYCVAHRGPDDLLQPS